MTIGQLIRDFRKERRMTLTELAGRLEISPSYLSAIERNIRRPSASVLKNTGEILDIPLSLLAGSEEDILTGKRLREIREGRGLSLEDLSEISDIPVGRLVKFEEGRDMPDQYSLDKLSAGLNVTLKYFMRGNKKSNSLGDGLRKMRMSRNITIQALAEKAGISPGLISQIENGQTTPHLETLEAIAKVLNTSSAHLLMEGKNTEDLLATFNSEMMDVLGDPNVQAVLRSIREMRTYEIRFIINYIRFYSQNRTLII